MGYPKVVRKANIEIVRFNQLKVGDKILFSDSTLEVVDLPPTFDEKIKCLQFDEIELEIGPFRTYYRILKADERHLCSRCFQEEVKNPGEHCKECREDFLFE